MIDFVQETSSEDEGRQEGQEKEFLSATNAWHGKSTWHDPHPLPKTQAGP